MNVFISWSGEKSKEIAVVFRQWLPSAIQAVRPFFSDSDNEKGARWANEISKELEKSQTGLILLTKENLKAPWIMFEAGALSKSMDKSRVCTMLFGVEPTELEGPLVQFQATKFSKEEVKKFMVTINSCLKENQLESEVLNGVFEKWWPDLEKEINEIMSRTSHASPPIRSEKDMVEEILNLTRGQVERLNKVEETLVTIQKTSRPRPSWTIGDAFQPTSIPGGFDTNALYRALLERDTKKDDEEKSKKQ